MIRRCYGRHLMPVPCILEEEQLDFLSDLSFRSEKRFAIAMKMNVIPERGKGDRPIPAPAS